jgi:hypothetical protein
VRDEDGISSGEEGYFGDIREIWTVGLLLRWRVEIELWKMACGELVA